MSQDHSASSPRQIASHKLTGDISGLLDVFAARHRLKITLDDCHDQIIRGKHGDLSDFCDGEHLIATIWGNGPRFSRLRARRIRLALECQYGQCRAGGIGADEALILFSPNEERSATFFIHALGLRRKRRVNADVIERLGSHAKRAKATSGRALQTVETMAERVAYIAAQSEQLAPEISSLAINPFETDGAK